MQQIRPILPQSVRQIPAQSNEWVRGNAPYGNIARNRSLGFIGRNVGYEIVIRGSSGKRAEQISDVDLVPGQAAADGVGINGYAHL
jgi:hypothetical protein